MQTEILPELLDTADGREADAILRNCVHCGFCTATCPTYQLLGDELDGPRGRIYQIKSVLEGETPTRVTQLHLDRCLTCRSCETTCPSGVRYARLLDIGRHLVDERVRRPLVERWLRRGLVFVLSHAGRARALIGLARLLSPLLPSALRAKVPRSQSVGHWPRPHGRRRVLVLGGCVQAAATPATNAAAARILDRLGIDLVEPAGSGCCGAVAHHLDAREDAIHAMKRNIDAWWPEIESGCEAVLVNASACGAMVKEYGELLANDPDYAVKAAQVSELARDPAELLAGVEDLSSLGVSGGGRRVAFHAPCSLQHGQRIRSVVESILVRCGFVPTQIADAHLCCGSAGTYSITQPELSLRLRDDKLSALASGSPEVIATANIGCQLHLDAGTEIPVVHWLELLDPNRADPDHPRS
ncbi:protein of unknown function DUF224 cysteine-rich region domain protein [Thiorhodococcus drewsii AZ1]|uniref:Glycolate oxidase iron-sulfur subunit n=1 Tax=Thiorhodococcus drewsii AZ1 TaxID=765913 RepID=G2E004_9GAMM|nr:glycolate oxidase subunit GlcF [Thiorhodococcus drewsii]EGV32043.1 protein of unknown function DUF224 cysteine-rich region domain protein [Thiorhodococcus drewsii AZ1]